MGPISALILFTFTSHTLTSVSCQESVFNTERAILRHCEPCSNASVDRFSGKEFNKKLITLFSSGVPKILWDQIPTIVANESIKLSPECKQGLLDVTKAMEAGEEWAFRVIDSSGKTPPGFLTSTISSPGDYDECLEVASHSLKNNFEGKYCMVDMFPLGPTAKTDTKVSLSAIPVYTHSPIYVALCLPSTCPTKDVRPLVRYALRDYPLSITGDISCDTKESVSYLTRIKNVTFIQVVAIFFLVVMASLVGLGTMVDVATPPAQWPSIRSFSALKNIQSLFYVTAEDAKRVNIVDILKIFIIGSGTMAHILTCLETPLALWVINHHQTYYTFFGSIYTQPIFNEAGLVTMTYISGFATLYFIYPQLVEKRLSYPWAIFDRWIRFIPSILSIMALDLIWPLMGSGPFYTRVGIFILNKCTKNWWMNVLFISNFVSALDICVPHTYFSAIDLQLFVVALFAITLLYKNRALGTVFCWAIIIGANCIMCYMANKHQTTATLFDPHPSGKKTLNFLDYIHMASYTYFPSYFMGIMLAYRMKMGYKLKVNSIWDHAYYCVITLLIGYTGVLAPAIQNTFEVVPQHMAPYVAVFTRFFFSLTMGFALPYLATFTEKDASQKSRQQQQSVDGNKNDVDEAHKPSKIIILNGDNHSFLRALTRLSFAIYMSNYFFVRTDFFIERSLFTNSLFHMVKKLISSFVFIGITAFFFQIIFVAPFDNLRRLWYKSFDKKKTS